MRKLIIILIFCAFSSLDSFGQCLKIDSLQKILYISSAKGWDTSRIHTLNLLAMEYLTNKQVGQAWAYAIQATNLSKNLNYEEGIADALIVIGKIFYDDPLKRDKESLPRYLQAVELYRKINKPEKIAYGSKVIGDYYYNLFYLKDEHFPEALKYYEDYVTNVEKTGNKLATAKAYAFLGYIYNEMGEDGKSKELFLKAVELREQMSDAEVDDPHLFAKIQRSYTSQIQSERFLNYALGIGVILLFLMVFSLFFNVAQKRRTNLLLQKQNDEIEEQRKSITAQNFELEKQKSEIQEQHDQLAEQNKQIVLAQEEIKQANEKLKTVNQRLEEKVVERTHDLVSANNALVEANEELDTLIYRASHDFKGPVATLTGLAQVARMECEEGSPTREFLDKIEFTAQKMDTMLEKLHQVSYLIGKNLTTDLIDFEQVLGDAKELLANTLENKNIQFHLEADKALHVFSDHELLTIILENMLENSIQYRSQDPRTIPQIDIKISHVPDGVIIEVRDNGIGIPEKYFDKIYDMFFRGTELAKGNGLGLYVVKKALEKISATIHVFSEENEYTIFRIKLPR